MRTKGEMLGSFQESSLQSRRDKVTIEAPVDIRDILAEIQDVLIEISFTQQTIAGRS